MLLETRYAPRGKHLVAGTWIAGDATFASAPAHGPAYDFAVGTPELAEAACAAAEEAFWSYGYSTREERATFLNAIADEIEARADAITEIGSQETGLPEVRLQGERGRTVGQLRLFAEHILKGDYLDRRHDKALPDRKPLPRPDLKLVQRPIGPVAVFGASNFHSHFRPPAVTPPRPSPPAARSWSRDIRLIPERAKWSPMPSKRPSTNAGASRVSSRSFRAAVAMSAQHWSSTH